MAIDVFPTPVTSVVDLTSFVNIAVANTLYETTASLGAGTYTITCPSANVANVEFWNGTTRLAFGVTASGTVSVVVPSAATSIRFWTTSGTNILVGFKKTGESLTGNSYGTYTTHTTTTTVSVPGTYLFTIVGGGGGGTAGISSRGGGGGASG